MVKFVKDPSGKKYRIKIDEDFEWLWPFFLKAKKLVPIWRVKRIKGYYVPIQGVERQSASITPVGKRFKIMLLSYFQRLTKSGKNTFKVEAWYSHQTGSYYESTLNSLAHELSHIVHWEHTADRLILEKRIDLMFSRLAKKMGYEGYRG